MNRNSFGNVVCFPLTIFAVFFFAFFNQYCFTIVAITHKQSRDTGIASAIMQHLLRGKKSTLVEQCLLWFERKKKCQTRMSILARNEHSFYDNQNGNSGTILNALRRRWSSTARFESGVRAWVSCHAKNTKNRHITKQNNVFYKM